MSEDSNAPTELKFYSIAHRWTREEIFRGQFSSFKACVEAAVTARADLTDADLAGANLTGANLTDANLAGAKSDFRSILDLTPNEVPALRAAIVAGNIDGSVYEGPCACLVGTIAKARRCTYNDIPGVVPASHRPAERLFSGLAPGHTPERNPIAKLIVEWIDEWTAERPTITA